MVWPAHKFLKEGGLVLTTEPSKKIAFCHVQKASSSLWMEAFADMNNIKQGDAIYDNKYAKVASIKYSYYARDIDTLNKLNMTFPFKFMFVRHPFARLASAYHDKFVINQKKEYFDYVRRYQLDYMNFNSTYSCLSNGKLNFSCFIDFVLHEASNDNMTFDMECSTHWWPYTELCRVCRIHYDLIGHVETIQKDIEILVRRFPDNNIFKEMKEKRKKVHCIANCNKSGKDLYLNYFSQIPVSTINRLYARFKNDFQFGGYGFPREWFTNY